MNKKLSKVLYTPLDFFLKNQISSGILLAFCAILAMVLANSSWSDQYFAVLQIKFLGLSVQHWINDGLMTIFFFVIGMEIKKELLVGELSSWQKAALPAAAALGGMVVPALIYISFNSAGSAFNGWGIPMATDIAFALGVLTLFGKRVPLSLKVFLLALAIVDDLGAILVIAFFYTKEIHAQGLWLAVVTIGFLLMAQFFKVRSYWIYVILGAVAWFGVLSSGVHATVAGVAIGLMTPLEFSRSNKEKNQYSPLDDLVHFLHPWVGFFIMPVFALGNAGIALRGLDFFELVANPVHQGIVFALLIGKPLGILVFSGVAVFIGIGRLPTGLRWGHLAGAAFLGGIGFTMSIFISNLALSAADEVFSKTGIVIGSLAAGIVGSIILKFTLQTKDQCPK